MLGERAALAVQHQRLGEVWRIRERFADRNLRRLGERYELLERRAVGELQLLVDVLPVVADPTADQDVDFHSVYPLNSSAMPSSFACAVERAPLCVFQCIA